jgi:hypothetical protein
MSEGLIIVLSIIGCVTGFFLIWPWIICYWSYNKFGNPFTRYLNWVYDVINKEGKYERK